MHVKTINLYERMKNENSAANLAIFFLVINACAERGLELRCRLIASQIPSSMLSDLKLQTALIHMWVGDISVVYLCNTFPQLIREKCHV